MVGPPADIDIAGLRRSSKWLDMENADLRHSFIGHKKQKKQTDNAEFHSNDMAETPDTTD